MQELERRRSVAGPLAALVVITVVAVGLAAYRDAARPTLAAVHVAVVLGCAMLLAAVCLTPWQRLSAPKADQKAALAEFPPKQLLRAEELARAAKSLARLGKLVGLPLDLVFGLTPVGSIAITWLAEPFGGSHVAQVVVGSFAFVLLAVTVSIPFKVRAHVIGVRFGLTSQKWAGWIADQIKQLILGTVLVAVLLTIIYSVMAWLPNWWWLAALGLVTALLTVYVVVYPVSVARRFNKFTPLPEGSLRDRLLALAARDGVNVRDVMVADASRRTNMGNAGVMGFGPTRMIVIFDNVLNPPANGPMGAPRAATDDEIVCIIGHELAHAKYRDVPVRYFVLVLQLCQLFCTLFLLNNWHGLLDWVRVDSITDGHALALVMLFLGQWFTLFGPLTNLLGRRVEAAGDWHALTLVRDPANMESMLRWVFTTMPKDPNPGWFQRMYETHPPVVWRIALARAFAREHGTKPRS